MALYSFAPYALNTPESGLISLLANYLANYDSPVVSLSCNGVIPVCHRIAGFELNRPSNACFHCMQEQQSLSHWSSSQSRRLSDFIMPEDIEETKRWMAEMPKLGLLHAEFDGINLNELCRETFVALFEDARPDLMNRGTEYSVRRVLLSAARLWRGMNRFIVKARPDQLFVAGGSEYFSAILCQALRQRRIPHSIFAWNEAQREVLVFNSRSNKSAVYPLFFDDISALRADCQTWPSELIRLLEELMAFLGVANNQIDLPLAR